MRKIYTKTFVYFAEIQYIYNEINNRNIIMDILNSVSYTHMTMPTTSRV